MTKEERKIITKVIKKTKSPREEEEMINNCITQAFEEGRIIEAEYYSLLLQHQISVRLKFIASSLEEMR